MVDETGIRELETKLEMRNHGKVVVQIGLLATMYFRNAHNAEVQRSILKCFDRYRAVAGDALRWVKHPRTFAFHPIDSAQVPSPGQWLNQLRLGEEWEFEYRGGADSKSADPFSMKALGVADTGLDELSYFKVTLPMTFFAQNVGKFPNLILEFCRQIRPDQGYGGLGILDSPDRLIAEQYEPVVYQIAKRFPGLEVDYPTSHSIWVQQENGIKGGNWLTILGDAWLQKMGSVQGLRGKLSTDFQITEYPGGALIKAGPRPQMGDIDKGVSPELYARLATVLKPIRIEKHRMFHHVGQNRFDKVASEAWLARFDGAPELSTESIDLARTRKCPATGASHRLVQFFRAPNQGTCRELEAQQFRRGFAFQHVM